MYWKSFTGIFKYILLMSIVMNFASRGDMMLLNRIFIVYSPVVLILTSPSYFSWSPPAVILGRLGSDFSGRASQHIWAYMVFFFAGFCWLWIQWQVSVPFTCWVLSAFFLYAGRAIRIHSLWIWSMYLWTLGVLLNVDIRFYALSLCLRLNWYIFCISVWNPVVSMAPFGLEMFCCICIAPRKGHC